MVCSTTRGHRQDGNDYDEGDLGLESLGQVWSDTTRSQRLPKALEFLPVLRYHAHLTHMYYVYCMYILY